MRPREKDRHLPACVYLRHGAYYYVKRGKWTRLGSDFAAALAEYARIHTGPGGEMAALIDAAMPGILREKAGSTSAQYRAAADRLREAFIEFRPSQVRQKHVVELRDSMADTPNMANRVLSVLRQVLAYAVARQMIDTNPAIGVGRLGEAKRARYLTDAESAAQWSKVVPIIDAALLAVQKVHEAKIAAGTATP